MALEVKNPPTNSGVVRDAGRRDQKAFLNEKDLCSGCRMRATSQLCDSGWDSITLELLFPCQGNGGEIGY